MTTTTITTPTTTTIIEETTRRDQFRLSSTMHRGDAGLLYWNPPLGG